MERFEGESANLASEDEIRRRIEVRVNRGDFMIGMLHVAKKESVHTQEKFVDQLSAIAASVRAVLETNGLIQKIDYEPASYWPRLRGKAVSFLDGGVANIELPSAAPLGIRVGSYTVRPGESDPSKREQFSIQLMIVDDLYSDDAHFYDDDFADVAKLRDAARIISETAAAWHMARDAACPDIVLLHGPLINPASPYGLEGFPHYSLGAARQLLADDDWKGEKDERNFVALYLELLSRLKASGRSVYGVVERSMSKKATVFEKMLANLQDGGVMRAADVKTLTSKVELYGLNDATLLDVVLGAGEYVEPVSMNRQGPENKWPDYWKAWIRTYPEAFTTYLKPSELVTPFRVEGFEGDSNFRDVISLVLHTSRLLPSYGFPVGLDIVDKFAKVPEWMSRGVRGQHQIVLLKKALASGDPRALTFAKRVLAAKGRDWFFRPTA
ncbi:MAG: DNA double-strand break repair nuclease NurA [Verrucomicrobiaceae bacterium]|nr:MAG: DNA double-strand break repair nuclease NurA [Verrucomicrobiaceae bacterium]